MCICVCVEVFSVAWGSSCCAARPSAERKECDLTSFLGQRPPPTHPQATGQCFLLILWLFHQATSEAARQVDPPPSAWVVWTLSPGVPLPWDRPATESVLEIYINKERPVKSCKENFIILKGNIGSHCWHLFNTSKSLQAVWAQFYGLRHAHLNYF